jgi:hypothetical protein
MNQLCIIIMLLLFFPLGSSQPPPPNLSGPGWRKKSWLKRHSLTCRILRWKPGLMTASAALMTTPVMKRVNSCSCVQQDGIRETFWTSLNRRTQRQQEVPVVNHSRPELQAGDSQTGCFKENAHHRRWVEQEDQ